MQEIAATTRHTLLLTRSDVEALLDAEGCLAAIEEAFRADAGGETLPAGVLGTRVPGGGFHVKTAGLLRGRPVYAAKVNANFPENPARRALPAIQGVVALVDARDGRLLALMDSASITARRTAAASAVAARWLARVDARVATVVGCGIQGRAHVRALARVRSLARVFVVDRDGQAARRLAAELEPELGFAIEPVADHRAAAQASDIVVTCTPSRAPMLGPADVRAGTFVAAVGADSEDKQELDPTLLAASHVVVDVLEQCATIGELHHALRCGAVRRDEVRATLAQIVSGARAGRTRDDETFVFDSTGTALEDVAAALLVYERAVAAGRGRTMRWHE